ncbi:MAG: hypothetical protein QX198_11025 [Methylococcaceae bacterium]
MSPKYTCAVLLLFLSSLSNVHAGGEPVHEDLSAIFLLSENMIERCKQHDSEGFRKSANLALQLTAENRNNSIILPRASAKFRTAKSAVKVGKFTEAIEAIEQAQTIMQKKKVLRWDGGS